MHVIHYLKKKKNVFLDILQVYIIVGIVLQITHDNRQLV